MTQIDLANATGISANSISSWESGRRDISIQRANMIFGALGYCLMPVSKERIEEKRAKRNKQAASGLLREYPE